ncbi:MAG: hypothetical protein QM664_11335 [Flavihumibacter sp.]
MRTVTKTLLALLVLSLSGCLKDRTTKTYTLFKPVYEKKETVLKSIKSGSDQPLEKPGKMYVYGPYLLVNEINEGVHVFNIADAAKPVNQAFIRIPGNLDIAVRGNILYADIYSDMLTLDISDPQNAKLLNNYPNVFPERVYSNGFMADSTQYIVGWEQRDTTVTIDDTAPCFWCGPMPGMWLDYAQVNSLGSSGSKAPIGVAGSMARFSVVDQFLYLVNDNSLQAYDISAPAAPAKSGDPLFMGAQLETIYPFGDKLFIGATTGMFICDISASGQPVLVGQAAHFRVCDPVITDGNFAYVTLRSSAVCGTVIESQLQVMDVRDVRSPSLLKKLPLSDPYGLGKWDNLLWVCDGEAGLKIFDVSTPAAPVLKQEFKNINPFDVIPLGQVVVVSAKEGVFLYDCSDPGNIHLASKI